MDCSSELFMRCKYYFELQLLFHYTEKFGNGGCQGGLMDDAFRYLESVKGLETEQEYSYKAEVRTLHL